MWMLWVMWFSLQAKEKVIESSQQEESDAQLDYLNRCVEEHIAADQQMISVDKKKKELVEEFKKERREYQPKSSQMQKKVQDFIDKELNKKIP